MKQLFFFIVGLIIGVCVVFFNPFKKPTPSNSVITNPITQYLPKPVKDTIIDIVYKDTGSHTILIDSVLVLVPIPIDTTSIVADYLRFREYAFDSTFNNVNIKDSISIYANQIVRYKQVLSYNELPKVNMLEIRAGLMFGINEVTPIVTFGKAKYTFVAGYDLVGQDRGLRVGLTYKIK